MGCFVVAEFLLTSASRGPSAIAEPLVIIYLQITFRPTTNTLNSQGNFHVKIFFSKTFEFFYWGLFYCLNLYIAVTVSGVILTGCVCVCVCVCGWDSVVSIEATDESRVFVSETQQNTTSWSSSIQRVTSSADTRPQLQPTAQDQSTSVPRHDERRFHGLFHGLEHCGHDERSTGWSLWERSTCDTTVSSVSTNRRSTIYSATVSHQSNCTSLTTRGSATASSRQFPPSVLSFTLMHRAHRTNWTDLTCVNINSNLSIYFIYRSWYMTLNLRLSRFVILSLISSHVPASV